MRVWLHRIAPTDVQMPWALALSERCRRYNVLPGPGGAYDQDEYLMAAMEQAAGANVLFDGDSQMTMRFLDIHTSLGQRAQAIIDAVNAREAREQADEQSES